MPLGPGSSSAGHLSGRHLRETPNSSAIVNKPLGWGGDGGRHESKSWSQSLSTTTVRRARASAQTPPRRNSLGALPTLLRTPSVVCARAREITAAGRGKWGAEALKWGKRGRPVSRAPTTCTTASQSAAVSRVSRSGRLGRLGGSPVPPPPRVPPEPPPSRRPRARSRSRPLQPLVCPRAPRPPARPPSGAQCVLRSPTLFPPPSLRASSPGPPPPPPPPPAPG